MDFIHRPVTHPLLRRHNRLDYHPAPKARLPRRNRLKTKPVPFRCIHGFMPTDVDGSDPMTSYYIEKRTRLTRQRRVGAEGTTPSRLLTETN